MAASVENVNSTNVIIKERAKVTLKIHISCRTVDSCSYTAQTRLYCPLCAAIEDSLTAAWQRVFSVKICSGKMVQCQSWRVIQWRQTICKYVSQIIKQKTRQLRQEMCIRLFTKSNQRLPSSHHILLLLLLLLLLTLLSSLALYCRSPTAFYQLSLFCLL